MPYELTARVQEAVLFATATGVRNLQTVAAIAQELKNLCQEHGVVKVLVDVRGLEGRLPTLDTLLLVTRHFKTLRDLRVLRKAAVLDQNLSKKGMVSLRISLSIEVTVFESLRTWMKLRNGFDSQMRKHALLSLALCIAMV